MFTKTNLGLFAVLMLGPASGALANDVANHNDGAEMRSHAHAVKAKAPRAERQIAPGAYAADAYRLVPAPGRWPAATWPRMNCDLPIGC